MINLYTHALEPKTLLRIYVCTHTVVQVEIYVCMYIRTIMNTALR